MLEIGEQQGATDCCEFCKAAGAVEEGLARGCNQTAKPPGQLEPEPAAWPCRPNRCQWIGLVGGVEPVGDGAEAFALASLKRGVSVRAKKDSAGSVTGNAAYWQMPQTVKPLV